MPAAIPLAVAAVSYAGARSQANAASSAAEASANAQERMANNRLAFDKQKYDRYKSIYGPLEEKEAADAMQDGPLDYGLIRSHLDRQYANLGRGMTEQANNSGMQASGLDAAKRQAADIQHGEALSTAYGVGLMNRRNYRSAVMNHNQLPQAGNSYSNSLGSLSDMYGGWRRDANSAAREAQSAAAGGFNGLMRLGGAYAYSALANQDKDYGRWESGDGYQTGPYGDNGAWASVLTTPYGSGGGDDFNWVTGSYGG